MIISVSQVVKRRISIADDLTSWNRLVTIGRRDDLTFLLLSSSSVLADWLLLDLELTEKHVALILFNLPLLIQVAILFYRLLALYSRRFLVLFSFWIQFLFSLLFLASCTSIIILLLSAFHFQSLIPLLPLLQSILISFPRLLSLLLQERLLFVKVSALGEVDRHCDTEVFYRSCNTLTGPSTISELGSRKYSLNLQDLHCSSDIF